MSKIVTCNGCFDGLHPGHLFFLGYCKALGDKLVVGINSDEYIKENKRVKPHFNEKQRKLMLKKTGVVDRVIVFNENSPIEFMKKVGPDIHCTGEEYLDGVCPEEPYCKEHDIRLVYVPRTKINWSTSSFTNKELREYTKMFFSPDRSLCGLERELNRLGLDIDDRSCLLLVPAIYVAWSDKSLAMKEFEQIYAGQKGTDNKDILLTEAGRKFLNVNFIYKKPENSMIEETMRLCRIYLGLVRKDKKKELVAHILETCNRVAQADGWLKKVSNVEKKSIKKVFEYLGEEEHE